MEKSAQQAKVPLPKSKRGLKGYLNETGRELRKVVWPTPKETTRLTGVVLIVCCVVTGALLLLNSFFNVFVNFLTTGSPHA